MAELPGFVQVDSAALKALIDLASERSVASFIRRKAELEKQRDAFAKKGWWARQWSYDDSASELSWNKIGLDLRTARLQLIADALIAAGPVLLSLGEFSWLKGWAK